MPDAPSKADDPTSNPEYGDSIYRECFDSFPIPGLCNSFATAATLLRIARRELRVALIPDGALVVKDFYSLLQSVEKYMAERDEDEDAAGKCHNGSSSNNKFIIEIEGLDGSGKTTLCRSLTELINEMLSSKKTVAIATKTPSACLKKIRPLFDHRGGILARVFYTMSNYILEYEIHNMSEEIGVVIVDRWYASTLAYTVAYREGGGDPDVEGMEKKLFAWPRDLKMKPNLLLVLNIHPDVRRARVDQRRGTASGASLFNPWDDRLDKDLKLGERILVALSRIHSSGMLVESVDANNTITEVLEDATGKVVPEYRKFLESTSGNPKTASGSDSPLEEWKHDAQRLGLCDKSGKRCSHALWNLQVAFSDGVGVAGEVDHQAAPVSMVSTPPVLKTVGLDRIADGCVYYWVSNTGLFSADSSNGIVMSSVVWEAGTYPMEFQWRAEGFATRVTNAECELRGYRPPNSLLAHMSACNSLSTKGANDTADGGADRGDRPTRTETYQAAVDLARKSPEDYAASPVCMVRFVPLRVEVLRGGPSTRGIDGYPLRLQWIRTGATGAPAAGTSNANDDSVCWNARSILPFTTIAAKSVPTRTSYRAAGITLALTGCHASGKTTIGKALAKLLGWRFDPELGEVLREKNKLQPGGHMYGDGSSSSNNEERNTAMDWDDLIFDAETARDKECAEGGHCRVVETWHVGNSKWYALRQRHKKDNGNDSSGNGSDIIDVSKYINAMQEHKDSSVVIHVHLGIPSFEVMHERRMHNELVRERLPLKDEIKECKEMFQVLQMNATSTGQSECDSWVVPTLHVDNGGNGAEAISETIQTILSFVQKHQYKRAQPV